MVILDGRAKVCLDEDGRERVITERGPGDLIGESGTVPGYVRSATMIALDTVQALVMRTEDYTAFIADFPGVPDLVRSRRTTGGPAGREHAVQRSDAHIGRTDAEHDRPVGRLDRPRGPRAAPGLDGDQGAKLVLGLGPKGQAQAVRGLVSSGQRPGHQLLPAPGLSRDAGCAERARDGNAPRHEGQHRC